MNALAKTDRVIQARYLWSDGILQEYRRIEISDGVITAIGEADRDAAFTYLVTVPFSDLQVNGGGGVLFNNDPTVEGLRRIAKAHARLGTADILPTVITDRPEVTKAAARAVAECAGETGILGIHIEGPHLSLPRRGTHRARDIRPLDRRMVDLVNDLRADGVRVMITLAPEEADPHLLAQLVDSGAVVSAGHSSATAAQARAAFGQGVTCVTHLFNAMEQMHSREAGLLGATLNSRVPCGVICDGLHVSWDMLRIALKARGPDAPTFVVSDAMATVGGPDHFRLYDQMISVRDGRLVNAEGALAGAHIDMRQSLANLVGVLDLPLTQALAMVTDIPRRVMGLPARRITAGTDSTALLLLDEHFTILAM